MSAPKKSGYERPNQKWVCGRTDSGEPCLAGPNARGKCEAAIPCRPKLSLRAWRGYAVLITIAASLSAILLALTFSPEISETALSPGELGFQHSTYKSQCSDCHVNASSESPALAWFGGHHSSGANSQACLKCHNLGAKPLAPHAMPAADLDALNPKPLAAGSPMHRQSDWACSTCHVEHRGKESSLTQISDQQCQSCHAAQFASFSTDHPEFSNYPFYRRTRINFDHRSHLEKHFKEERAAKTAPNSCVACHTSDPKGSSMLVKSFEATCAACHLDQIKGKTQIAGPGITVIRLPAVDAETLADKKFEIGDWPEGAEGTIPPLMEWLLGSTNVSKLDLSDLTKADTNRLAQAAAVAWSIKELIHDVGAKGQAEWERRLKAAPGGELAARQTESLVGLLSAEVIRAMSKRWFPNLEAEIAQHRGGKKPTTTPPATSPNEPAATKPEEWVSRGGWYRNDLDYSLSYRPVGHADPFFRSWLDLTVAIPEAQKLFTTLATPTGPGTCAKCHSVDALPNPAVHWRAFQTDPFDHRFTRFSHTSHFSLLDDRGCQTCHSLDLKAPADRYASFFAPSNRDPGKFFSNFQPIQRQTCATCHTSRFAGEGCLECHNYHIGRFTPTLPREAWTIKAPKPSP